MVPATLTFALPSADIPSGPPGDEIVTAGGAAWLYPLPPFNILILLLIGSFTGGYLGAHLSKLKGNKLIKKTFTIVCFLVGTSLLIKSFKNFT